MAGPRTSTATSTKSEIASITGPSASSMRSSMGVIRFATSLMSGLKTAAANFMIGISDLTLSMISGITDLTICMSGGKSVLASMPPTWTTTCKIGPSWETKSVKISSTSGESTSTTSWMTGITASMASDSTGMREFKESNMVFARGLSATSAFCLNNCILSA